MLGEGGMGAVYEVISDDDRGPARRIIREFAIKIFTGAQNSHWFFA